MPIVVNSGISVNAFTPISPQYPAFTYNVPSNVVVSGSTISGNIANAQSGSESTGMIISQVYGCAPNVGGNDVPLYFTCTAFTPGSPGTFAGTIIGGTQIPSGSYGAAGGRIYSTDSVTLTGVTAGNQLFACWFARPYDFVGIGDTQYNAYSQVFSNRSESDEIFMYTAPASASGTVTIYFSNFDGGCAVSVGFLEISDYLGVDVSTNYTGTGTDWVLSSGLTTTADNDLSFTFVTGYEYGTAGSNTFTEQSPYVISSSGVSNNNNYAGTWTIASALLSAVVASPSTINPGVTATLNASPYRIGAIAILNKVPPGIITQQIITPSGVGVRGASVAVLQGDLSSVDVSTFPGSPLATVYDTPTTQNVVSNPVVTDGYGNVISSPTANGAGIAVASGYYVLQIQGGVPPVNLIIPVYVGAA